MKSRVTLTKNYLNGSKPDLSTYAVPEADINEILIEKTPEIINGGYEMLKQRAQTMKETMKGVKLLVMLCDPVKRFISLEKHHTSPSYSPQQRDEITGLELKFSFLQILIENLHFLLKIIALFSIS